MRKPTDRDDKFSKIDGWWDDDYRGQHPLQIKYRDSGDDILFEVMKDFENGVWGRDMVGKATHYAVLSRDGKTVRIVLVKDAKAIINQMLHSFHYPVRGGEAILRIRPDPKTGVEKLMAYIPVSALPIVQQHDMQVEF